jgi:hydrogenase-4 component E
MIFRMKALAQVIGLLVMENGLFLAAAGVSGGMPFFVEIAIFFDVFLCVIILGMFIYRINSLFTHIDVDKLTKLKG